MLDVSGHGARRQLRDFFRKKAGDHCAPARVGLGFKQRLESIDIGLRNSIHGNLRPDRIGEDRYSGSDYAAQIMQIRAGVRVPLCRDGHRVSQALAPIDAANDK
jgi:hypothetical protein